ncbi:DUF1737 domain-containing protein [Micromonospora sp. LAH09]|uniref:DUF1737 domain-containing protein n=1 Tax=Micromonospora cabrerizensis TaxID=2911213 RepID=UPI001EE91E95|nr:DUF1737 domain-containing protein [Micromonospora cabrerizensis]MCG5469057.1 DUF1737 domain-containing protein [Micromonospora cabrerizensis]
MSDFSEPLGYRLITGPDDAEFCARVSALLDQGYQLYGSPALTFDGDRVIAAQAVVLPRSAGSDAATGSAEGLVSQAA